MQNEYYRELSTLADSIRIFEDNIRVLKQKMQSFENKTTVYVSAEATSLILKGQLSLGWALSELSDAATAFEVAAGVVELESK